MVGVGTYYLVSKNNSKKVLVTASTSQSATINTTNTSDPKVKSPSKCLVYTSGVIKYCDSGFSDYLKIELSEMDATVSVTNASSKVLDFEIVSHKDNSATQSPAQEHKLDPAMNLGKIEPGKSKSFEAVVPGIYTYKDANIPYHTGTIEIVAD